VKLDVFAIGQAAGFEELLNEGFDPVLIFLPGGGPGKEDELGFVLFGVDGVAHGSDPSCGFGVWSGPEPGAGDELLVGLVTDLFVGPGEAGDFGEFFSLQEAGLFDGLEGGLIQGSVTAPTAEEGLAGDFVGGEIIGGVVDGPIEVAGGFGGIAAGANDPTAVVGDAGDVVLLGPGDAGAGGGPVNPGDGGGEENARGAVAGFFQGATEDDLAFLAGDGPLGQIGGGVKNDAGDGTLEGVGLGIGGVTGVGIDGLGIDRDTGRFVNPAEMEGDAVFAFVPRIGILVGKEGGIGGAGWPEMLEAEVAGEDGVLAEGEEIAGGAGGGRISFS